MKNSISQRIGLVVAIVMFIIMTIMTIILQFNLHNTKMKAAEEHIDDATDYVSESLMYIMSQGVDDVEPYIEQIKDIGHTQEVRVVPANHIGSDTEALMDDMEKKVFLEKTHLSVNEAFNNEPGIRSIVPILAQESCLDCHEGAVGDCFGTISIRYSTREVKQSIAAQRRMMILITVLSVLITIAMIVVLINRLIIKGLLTINKYLKQFSKGDLSGEIDIEGRCEIGQAESALKILQHSLMNKVEEAERISHGDLSGTIRILSEHDVLGQSMAKMKERIMELVHDANDLAKAALNGDLQVRADESKHEGDFRTIVENINHTLDNLILPIRETSGIMEELAAKSLNVRMNGEHKGDYAVIKNAINLALDNLDNGFQGILQKSYILVAAANEIDTANHAVAQGATEQAGTLQEVTSKLQELASSAVSNSSNAKKAMSISDSTIATTRKGEQGMGQLSKAMNAIKESSDQTTAIVKSIDDISFQTNLLALNAAVEAARAGEAGKGFAVVAEEVRNLAMRSAEAAKNTAELVEQAVKNAEMGVEINQKVLKDFKDIAEQAHNANEVVKTIATASIEQSQGIEQINTSLDELNKVTQQNAANSEESAAASNEMLNEVREMQNMVSEFETSSK